MNKQEQNCERDAEHSGRRAGIGHVIRWRQEQGDAVSPIRAVIVGPDQRLHADGLVDRQGIHSRLKDARGRVVVGRSNGRAAQRDGHAWTGKGDVQLSVRDIAIRGEVVEHRLYDLKRGAKKRTRLRVKRSVGRRASECRVVATRLERTWSKRRLLRRCGITTVCRCYERIKRVLGRKRLSCQRLVGLTVSHGDVPGLRQECNWERAEAWQERKQAKRGQAAQNRSVHGGEKASKPVV